MSSLIRYAERGTIPHPGEAWRVVGCKSTVLTLHLLEATRVRPLLPSGFTLITPWPGKTVGGTLLTCYGPGSTLEYQEFGVVAGWVRCGRWRGFYISHLYVDSADSVEGGQRMGYPKELAEFVWPAPPPYRATVFQNGQPLCSLRWKTSGVGVRFPLQGATLSQKEDRLFRFRHRVAACWSLARAELEIPPSSPLAALRLGPPLLALTGSEMTGALGCDFADMLYR